MNSLYSPYWASIQPSIQSILSFHYLPFATHHDQWPFVVITLSFQYLPFTVVHNLVPLLAICSSASHHIIYFHYMPFVVGISKSLFGLTGTHQYSRRLFSLQSKVHIWRVDVLSVKTRVFAQVLSMKAIPPCGGDLLHRHLRVVGFDDIIDFELWMYQFYFSCVFCKLFKCNVIAFTLHLKGVGVKGIIVKGIIVSVV
jgi:hypothetical protein